MPCDKYDAEPSVYIVYSNTGGRL